MAPGGPETRRKRNAVNTSSTRRIDHPKRQKPAISQGPSPSGSSTAEHIRFLRYDWPPACGAFPPTIDTHAMLLPSPLQPQQQPQQGSSLFRAVVPPILSTEQVQLWHHSFAGTACSSLQFPVSKYRLLGVITKSLSWTNNSCNNSKSGTQKGKKKGTGPCLYPKLPARRTHMTEAAARRELRQLLPEEIPLEFRVLELKNRWDRELQASPSLQGQRTPWDGHGNLRPDLVVPQYANGAQSYVPVTDLHQWLCTIQPQQCNDNNISCSETADETSLDQMLQILLACQDLQDPSHLWQIPLLLTVPLVQHSNNSTTTTTTTIKMGVYGHRLLPLATTKTLGVVLNALDPDSYRVTAPLCQLPPPEQPTFATSPFPVVTFDADDDEEDHTSDRATALTTAAVEKENRSNSKTGKRLDEDCDDTGSDEDSSSDEGCLQPAAQPDRLNYDDWMEDRYNHDSITDRDDQRVSAFTTKGLLKLLENTGVDMTGYDTKIEPRLQKLLQLELLPHQQHAIQWMVQMEKCNNAKFGINSLLWEEREFWDGGRYYYCPALGQLRLEPPNNCTGGLLCDEMGLGKTIEVLGLILATLPELKDQAQETGGSYATLIVVPPALVGQWQNEIVKATGEGTLLVEYVDFHPTTTVPQWTTATTARHPDIVLTTYKALQVPKIAQQLNQTCWGRVVLDEMQEIRSSTTKFAKTCEKLQCNRRWMLSGTPLFEGIEDLRGELNFLRLEPFGANCEDGFFDFMIRQPWETRDVQAIEVLKTLSKVMMRRSKSMTVCASGAPLLGLPPLTVEYVPVQQTESERALYCYLEAVVSEEARAKDQVGKSKSSSRSLCLRLLREMCTSAVLLNGGLGIASQLKELNNLLIVQARRAANSSATGRTERVREYHHGTIVMSCDEAIMHLAQLQEATRAGSDEIACMALGFGQGLSRRVRASDSVELKLAEAEERLLSANAENQTAKSQCARTRWHLALEKLTMGVLPNQCVLRAETKFRTLWRLRSVVSALRAQMPGPVLPLVLRRGWRPGRRMTDSWHRTRPDFFWSHPLSFILEDIPCQVSVKELRLSLAEFLEDSAVGDSYSLAAALSNFKVSEIGASPASDSWRAGLVFFSYEAAAAFLEATRKPTGVHLSHQAIVPSIETRILQTKAAYREARAIESVQRTINAAAKRRLAKEAYKAALLGARIVYIPAARRTAGDVIVKRAQDFRSSDVNSSKSFFVSSSVLMDGFHQTLIATSTLISTEQRKIGRYRQAAGKDGPDAGVTALSAFDSLQALSNGASESTSCCICLDFLGSNDGGDDDAKNTACISMTKCGHLYCRGCLSECLDAATMNHTRPQCPACRKQIDSAQDVFFIDPTKKEKSASAAARENAKATVLTLSQALEQCSGCLSPQLWYKLFLSIDDPIGGDNSLDHRVSALPRHFMAHLRAAIDGLPVHSTMKTTPHIIDLEKNYISSKLKYLLHNLPKNERSVIFSSSKATVQHLLFLLRIFGIECRALFSGQKVDDSERAVAEWKSTEYETTGEALIPVPVLLVQSGAAASGLTLTASSKLFLVEPFLHQSEEQQAFGRSHRYGQEHPVEVKVLYTPVSVESRLLEWRRRGAATTIDTKIVYLKENEDSDDEDERSIPEAESDQTRFLLGLHAESLSATAELNVDSL